MSKSLKSIAVKGFGGLFAGMAIVVGTTHLLGGDRAGAFQVADIGQVSLASAQMGDLPIGDTTRRLPADALTPGKRLIPDGPVETPPQTTDCTASLDAVLMEGAMVRLEANAPCQPGARLSLHHAGLSFDTTIGGDGSVTIDMPALAAIAIFEADIGGETLKTVAAIPDFESYSRVALQWAGQTGLHIHALEFGAGYGGDGHVWAKSPGTSLRAVRARGGFITRLGDENLTDGRMAEIYVFPAAMIQRNGTVRLSVEAEVNAYSCGTSVEGQAMQPDAEGALRVTNLTLEIPDCDGVGDILVLKNLLQDMKIASN